MATFAQFIQWQWLRGKKIRPTVVGRAYQELDWGWLQGRGLSCHRQLNVLSLGSTLLVTGACVLVTWLMELHEILGTAGFVEWWSP